jgi:hypothetical protein
MKKRFWVTLIAVIVVTLILPGTAHAWNGVSGQVVDGASSDPWIHGGQVWVINMTNGNNLATGNLNGDGTFAINFGDDGVGCGCINNVSLPGHSLQVVVIPNAGPSGAPGAIFEDFQQNSIPIPYPTGYLYTDTGPTAVELADLSVTSQTRSAAWLPIVLLVGSILLVSSAVVIVRKKRI